MHKVSSHGEILGRFKEAWTHTWFRLIVFVLGLAAILLALQVPHLAEFLIDLAQFLIILTVLCTFLIALNTSPLKPLSETSILTNHVVTLLRWTFNVVIFFIGAVGSWMVSEYFQESVSRTGFSNIVSLLQHLVWLLLPNLWALTLLFSVIASVRVGIDVLRLESGEREKAFNKGINYCFYLWEYVTSGFRGDKSALLQKAAQDKNPLLRVFRRAGIKLTATWWWVLLCTYTVTPVLVYALPQFVGFFQTPN